jgi:hypothetical protein
MILRLHGVFLAYLLLSLVWNLVASARAGRDGPRPWERIVLWPLLVGLTLVLVRDRIVPDQSPWLTLRWVSHLFPLMFLGALAQNVSTILSRGPRLSDIPIVIFNVGMGSCLVVADLALAGVPLGRHETSLLYTHSVVQALIGTRLAHLWTLSWHLPLFLRRSEPTTLVGAAIGLVPAALGALVVLMLVALHDEAGRIGDSFGGLARVTTLRADLQIGITWRADRPLVGARPPGDIDVWRLPADHSGQGLPERTAGRDLVLELSPPAGWHIQPPTQVEAEQTFHQAALRLGGLLQPQLLIPFPEPDGEATLYFAAPRGEDTPAHAETTDWHALLTRLDNELAAVAPATRLGLRLAGTRPDSRALFDALVAAPSPLDVLGPRLEPGGAAAGRAGHARASLDTWRSWRTSVPDPPELWVLGVGASALAYGENAQERFVEGCLALASEDSHVKGLIVVGWRDIGHTLGMLRPDGRRRWAGRRLEQLLESPPADADR